jgi:hypothetical protein
VRACALSLVAVIVFVGCMAPAAPPAPAPVTWPTPKAAAPVTPSKVRSLLASTPLVFEENRGQTDLSVQFMARGTGMTAFFTPGGVTYRLLDGAAGAPPTAAGGASNDSRAASLIGGPPAQPPSVVAWQLQQEPIGGRDVRPTSMERAETVVSYLRGTPETSISGVPTYEGVAYPDLWAGIDAVYRADGQHLKSAYVVKPGADPSSVRLRLRGGQARLSEQGALTIETPLGRFQESAPVAWQDTPAGRARVSARFDLLATPDDLDIVEYGFTLGSYDPARPLIIDPTIAFAGFVGGNGSDEVDGVAVDGSGAAYATGIVLSSAASFEPTAGALDTTLNGSQDAFVVKVNPTGDTVVYKTYLGGDGNADIGRGVAVQPTCASSCEAYVIGHGDSGVNFPTAGGALDSTHNGGIDAWVVKLNATGTAPVWGGFIGGTGSDFGYSVAVDDLGNAYVAGEAGSNADAPGGGGQGFPNGDGAGSLSSVLGFDQTFITSPSNAFVARLAGANGALQYWTYLGGTETNCGTRGLSIAVDGTRRAYVAGDTCSTEATFPNGSPMSSLAIPGFDQTYNTPTTQSDIFAARLTTAGTALDYVTYVGGNSLDSNPAIAVDGSAAIYLTGFTHSEETSFPDGNGMAALARPGFDQTRDSLSQTAFAIKLLGTSSGAADVVYATYLGGTNFESGTAIGVPKGCVSACTAFVAGATGSNDFNGINGVGDPDPSFNGSTDGFVVQLAANGTSLIYGTYLGGGAGLNDRVVGMGVTSDGRPIVGMYTESDQASLPTGAGFTGVVTTSFDNTGGGGTTDGFILGLNVAGTSTFTPTATGTATSTATATGTATATATATSTPVNPCSPRPQVVVQTTRFSPGVLQAVVTASEQPFAVGNRVASVAFDRLDNGRVDVVGGPLSQSQPFTYTPATPLPQSVVFYVTRVAAGQATTIHLRVFDACGPWNTLVGGGPNGF